MNPDRVQQRGLQFGQVMGASLEGFELRFNKADRRHPGEGHANIMANRGTTVEGVLYHLSASHEILKMDPFERAPWNYGREAVVVQTEYGDPIWAWTYFANPAVQKEGLQPSEEYLAHLLAGEPWLSEDYLALLSAWPVAQQP